jgi:xylan 1,4-beta-xylosidase
MTRTFRNPVLPGCHPDPSICRVGDDFYLVTSSFEYAPGLPLFHSRDLVHWRPIGHAVDRPGQMSLATVGCSEGLYAPTLRHHDGVFHLTSTLVRTAGDGPTGNFLLTAEDPAGPWSDPVWLDVEGIDPSLFFDDDGRVWLCGTRESWPLAWEAQTEVWIREIDLTSGRPLGPEHVVWSGALLGAVWAEGPHLYKVDGQYFLVAAEGGTEHTHAVSVARADRVEGPYRGNPGNPVLTHRHLGRSHPVTGIGHADLVELADGSWWAVVLGTRPYGGLYENLGRETYLVRVVWEAGWPVFAPGTGQVLLEDVAPALPPHPWPLPPARDTFEDGLGPWWTSPRLPCDTFARPLPGGGLELRLQPATLVDGAPCSFMGRRQQHVDLDVHALLDFDPQTGDEWAGLAVRHSDGHNYLVVVAGPDQVGGPRRLLVVRRLGGRRTVLLTEPVPEGPVLLGLRVRGQDYTVVTTDDDGSARDLLTLDGRMLDSHVADSFVGVWLGLHATSNGMPTSTVAGVDWFEYLPLEEAVASRAPEVGATMRP